MFGSGGANHRFGLSYGAPAPPAKKKVGRAPSLNRDEKRIKSLLMARKENETNLRTFGNMNLVYVDSLIVDPDNTITGGIIREGGDIITKLYKSRNRVELSTVRQGKGTNVSDQTNERMISKKQAQNRRDQRRMEKIVSKQQRKNTELVVPNLNKYRVNDPGVLDLIKSFL